MSRISTFTGRLVDVFDPAAADIHIEDIAHSLAHICRYNGHVARFNELMDKAGQPAYMPRYAEDELDAAIESGTKAWTRVEIDPGDAEFSRPTENKPIRVQLSRKRGWRMPPNTVKVCRPSRWGNPFKADWPEGGKDRAWAVSAFRGALTPEVIEDARRELAGKNLACWCPLDQPCHADVLLDVANDGSEPR